MRLSGYRAKVRTFKRSRLSEFVRLEEYVNTGEYDLGAFASKQAGPWSPSPVPPLVDAMHRAAAVSEALWPRETHELDTKPSLVRNAPGSSGCVEAASVLPPRVLTDCPPPGCAMIWAMSPPEWMTREKKKR